MKRVKSAREVYLASFGDILGNEVDFYRGNTPEKSSLR